MRGFTSLLEPPLRYPSDGNIITDNTTFTKEAVPHQNAPKLDEIQPTLE